MVKLQIGPDLTEREMKTAKYYETHSSSPDYHEAKKRGEVFCGGPGSGGYLAYKEFITAKRQQRLAREAVSAAASVAAAAPARSVARSSAKRPAVAAAVL